MSNGHTITALEVEEIGEALYGQAWRGVMAKALGVPRQSIGYYLKSGGVGGTQAAAIIGLVARAKVREQQSARVTQSTTDARQADLSSLLARFETR